LNQATRLVRDQADLGLEPIAALGEVEPARDEASIREILARLSTFKTVSSPVLVVLVSVLPWGILGLLLFLVLIAQVREPMVVTGLVAAALAAMLFRTLLGQLPAVLMRLYTQRILLVRRAERSRGVGSSAVDATSGMRADDYIRYIDRFETLLNSHLGWLSGAVLGAAIYVSFPIRLFSPGWTRHVLDWVQLVGWPYLVFAGLQIAFAVILGLLVWRMVVIAYRVSRIGQEFELNIQPQHPDRSGGLKVLGDVCLVNASILLVPAVYLSAWLTAIPAFGPGNHYFVYVAYYYWLLVLVFTLATVAFVYPLLGVHEAMVRERTQLRMRLDVLTSRIDVVNRLLLSETDTARLQQLTDERALLEGVYSQNISIPVWPFDASVVRRFSVAQVVPLLSLTGLGPMLAGYLQKTLK